jgi:hypothetical protein
LPDLKIVSHFPGRLRVRAERFRERAFGAEVAERVRAEEGVSAAGVSELTGSLLVEYRPREIQLPRLVETILRIGGLDAISVDRGPLGAPQGDEVRAVVDRWNERLVHASHGRIDARTAVPGTLASLGVLRFLFGNRRLPEWYDLLFWSFVTFVNLNPPRNDDGPGPTPIR